MTPLLAGMPSVDWTAIAELRLQTLSFFLIGLLLSAGMVQWLWNALQKDFPRLPRFTYPKALGVVVLWGLLFVFVLTMISGARELLTPGAWEKTGWTYSLREPAEAESKPEDARWMSWTKRNEQLQKLRGELLQFAARNQGRFPTAEEYGALPSELRHLPQSQAAYRYLPPADKPAITDVLVHEPPTETPWGLALLVDGTVRSFAVDELPTLVAKSDREVP
jgi:hypothetical protein